VRKKDPDQRCKKREHETPDGEFGKEGGRWTNRCVRDRFAHTLKTCGETVPKVIARS
jgi:hypothetical protein